MLLEPVTPAFVWACVRWRFRCSSGCRVATSLKWLKSNRCRHGNFPTFTPLLDQRSPATDGDVCKPWRSIFGHFATVKQGKTLDVGGDYNVWAAVPQHAAWSDPSFSSVFRFPLPNALNPTRREANEDQPSVNYPTSSDLELVCCLE